MTYRDLSREVHKGNFLEAVTIFHRISTTSSLHQSENAVNNLIVIALTKGNIKMVTFLRDHVTIEILPTTVINEMTVTYIIIKSGHTHMFELFPDMTVDDYLATIHSLPNLHIAAEGKSPKMLKYLLAKLPEEDHHRHDHTALHHAIQSRNPLIMAQFEPYLTEIYCGIRDGYGRFPIHVAIENRQPNFAKILLDVMTDEQLLQHNTSGLILVHCIGANYADLTNTILDRINISDYKVSPIMEFFERYVFSYRIHIGERIGLIQNLLDRMVPTDYNNGAEILDNLFNMREYPLMIEMINRLPIEQIEKRYQNKGTICHRLIYALCGPPLNCILDRWRRPDNYDELVNVLRRLIEKMPSSFVHIKNQYGKSALQIVTDRDYAYLMPIMSKPVKSAII